MGIFNKKVVNEKLRDLRLQEEKVQTAFEVLKEKFSPSVQQRILTSNEESLQAEFIERLFDDVLGYIRFPDDDWNIKREVGSAENAEKADAAIAKNSDEEKVIAVIELKSTRTPDLQKVEKQAFKYFVKHPNCQYAITSNYQKVRLYVGNNQGFEEFDIFEMVNENQYDRFKIMYLYLYYEFVMGGVPTKLRQDTIIRDLKITNDLYTRYKAFRGQLFDDLQKNNPKIDKVVLFKKTQKLIDRFLFILFAEDKELLPAQTITKTIKEWDKNAKKTNISLFDAFKTLFQKLHLGNEKENIFAYNGGLFEPDPLLDNLVLASGNTLEVNLDALQGYDFATEVDVQILGHIFEHSLNDIDEIEGNGRDKSQTKRKKDGVFYTPQYITRYIVEQTIGVLCEQKEEELGLNDPKIKPQMAKKLLAAYREWLLTLTVIDPACGSGAFLNEALDFFLAEHQRIDEKIADIADKPIIYGDYAHQILQNNIFGVDLNEEAVEIAKLSLWLKTAKKGRQLSNLNENIKVGNSLIDDPKISEYAFNWKKEYPTVFQKGGFDVVIGNPPYGAKVGIEDIKDYVNRFSDFGISNKFNDTYFVFTAFSLSFLLKQNGILAFITPNTWRLVESGEVFRKKILTDFKVLSIIQHTEKVFAEATVDCDTFLMQKANNKDNHVRLIKKNYDNELSITIIPQKSLLALSSINIEIGNEDRALVEKINAASVFVKDILSIKNGVKPYEKGKGTPAQTEKTLLEKPFTNNQKLDATFVPLIGGSNFHRYINRWDKDEYISYGEWLAAPRDPQIFEAKEKLIFRQTSDKLIGTIIGSGFVMRNNTHILLKINDEYDLKYILAVLNSKLLNFMYWSINPEKGEALAEVKAFHLGLLPIKNISITAQTPFIKLADKMLSTTIKIKKASEGFTAHLKKRFPSIELKRSIENWHDLDFKGFEKEIEKQKCILLLDEKKSWQTYFEKQQEDVQALKTILEKTDKEIDTQVYALYDLTAAEIALVEKG